MTFFPKAADVLRLPLATDGEGGLRAAQIAAAHAVAAHFWASRKPAIVVMPTGSGKTAVMILATLLLRARRVLVVAPSRLLREQLAKKFEELDPLVRAGALEDGGGRPLVFENKERITAIEAWSAFEAFDVVTTTPHAASPGIDGVPDPPKELFDVIIFDEGHHVPAPIYQALANAFPGAKRLVLTATPFRRDEREISGELVFTYDLAHARRDGVFGRLRFVPVDVPVGTDVAGRDTAIARAAAQQLRADRDSGLDHRIVVRASSTDRADALRKIYEAETSLRLSRVHSGLTARSVTKAIDALRAGEIDGVIAVDMLGEGFDLPNLKVAALHSPHRSLAVTLQFIGRFARTTGDATLGEASFFAIPDEIEGDVAGLYVPGAEWNEIVEGLSRDQIALESDARTFIRTFERPSDGDEDVEEFEELSDDAAWALLRTVRPYFHVKAYDVRGAVNLDAPLGVPAGIDPILVRRSVEHNALVWIGREIAPVKWSRHEAWNNVTHDLFIVVHAAKHNILFVCASRRNNEVYDELVNSVAGDDHRRFAPDEINRVLRGVQSPEFFSLGMRNRAGLGGGGAESYRMLAGRAADRAVRAADGALYDRGHGFCRGLEDGDAVTIGFSSASKIWANRRRSLKELYEWCTAMAVKLRTEGAVTTGSGIDRLGTARRIAVLDAPVVAGDLPHEAYARESSRVRVGSAEEWLVDLRVTIAAQTSTTVEFAIVGEAIACNFSMDLGRATLIHAVDAAAADARVTDEAGRREASLLAYLNEHPPAFYLANLASVRGDQQQDPPRRDVPSPISAQIVAIDWATAKVDPYTEKPPGGNGLRSLFDYVQDELVAGTAHVVFLDDASNEIADYLSVEERDGRVVVTLYHCKAAHFSKKGSSPVPNDRIEDLHEVVAQAVKCRRFLDARRLLEQLEHRATKTKNSKFVRGTLADAEKLLADPARVVFEVVIVQPALRAEPKEEIAHLLMAADAYMRGGDQVPLRMWGTKGT